MATITPCSRCWVTGHLVIISRRKQSNGPGNCLHSVYNSRRTASTLPISEETLKTICRRMKNQKIYGRNFFRLIASSLLARRIIFGKWETRALVDLVPKFMLISGLQKKEVKFQGEI